MAVKEALNETRGQIQVTYHNNAGETEVLSGESLMQDKMDISDGETSGTNEETSGINEEGVPFVQVTDDSVVPLSPGATSEDNWQWTANPSPEEVENGVVPNMTPTTPPEKKTMRQPMEDNSPMDYLQKRRNKGRRLFRDRPVTQLGSVEERLQKAANRLDEHGECDVSNKIDLLLQKLCEVKNARKKSNIQSD